MNFNPFTLPKGRFVLITFILFVVTIRGNDEKQLKGVQITVHRSQGDIEELIGTFTEFPVDKLKVLNCIDGQEVNYPTHLIYYNPLQVL